LVSSDVALKEKYATTVPTKLKTHQVSSASSLATDGNLSLDKNTAIVYLPGTVSSMHDVPAATEENMWQALEVIKTCARHSLPGKVFIVTSNAGEGATPTALAHAPLAGLSRILSSEHPDEFGCHIDTEEEVFPLTALRYIQGDSVVRIRDGVPRTARLRSLPRDKLLRDAKTPRLLPKADGTYLITGGLGALGLAVAEFLVEKGARRLVLVSRRSLPPRKTWDNVTGDMAHAIAKVRELETQGAYIHVLALDIGKQSAAQELPGALDKLLLPPVRGVVHAAGVLNDQLALETTRDGISSVLAPKVTGSLVLDEVFPAKSLDFFVLFSSCGHLVGSTGQTAYGSANAFLDALARRRKNQGDRSVAFQWTAWRGMGMGASTDFIKFEFDSKGITDVTRDEAFGAWTHLGKYDMDHAVVLRSRPLEDGEPVPIPIITDIAIRRGTVDNGAAEPSSGGATGKPGPDVDLKTYLDQEIRNCVGRVLQIAPEDIDTKTALSDLGMDSVMTVNLRGQLQKTLKVQIPPTLTWSYPTVKHLVGWFEEKLAKD
jgi:6-methylsalicylic acid synthase